MAIPMLETSDIKMVVKTLSSISQNCPFLEIAMPTTQTWLSMNPLMAFISLSEELLPPWRNMSPLIFTLSICPAMPLAPFKKFTIL
jgi:hypothetical protein